MIFRTDITMVLILKINTTTLTASETTLGTILPVTNHRRVIGIADLDRAPLRIGHWQLERSNLLILGNSLTTMVLSVKKGMVFAT